MALTLQLLALVAVFAAVWQHTSAVDKAFSYSRQSVSGPPVVGPAQKIAVPGGHGQGHESFDYVAHPQYHNAYEVADPHSGDFHMHEEQREGDAVKGSYRIRDADGRVRTVHYTADAGGYRAEVSYSSPSAQHAPHRAPAPAHAPAPAEVHAQQQGRVQPAQGHPQVRVQPQIPSPPLHGLSHVGGQSHSHTKIDDHSHSVNHAQVHDVPQPAPVHPQLLQGPAHRPQPQGRGMQRAQLLRQQQRLQHQAQGLAHAQQLAEAQGLAHLQ